MSNLLDHADHEFAALIQKMRADGEDAESIEMQEHMHRDVRAVLEVISEQGHSGFSVNVLLNMVKRLGSYEPLLPIQGTDDEWVNVADLNDGIPLFQNRRCSHVFRNDVDGPAYDTQGRVLVTEDGATLTGIESRVVVTFPYSPSHVYIPYPDDWPRFERAGIFVGDYATRAEVAELYQQLKEFEIRAGVEKIEPAAPEPEYLTSDAQPVLALPSEDPQEKL